MVFEKIDLKIDIQKLSNHLYKFVLPLPSERQSEAFGGWSVLSSNGSYRDGWHRGYKNVEPMMTKKEAQESSIASGGKTSDAYIVPTEICTGYLLEVINYIQSLQLYPTRARIIELPANQSCVWHRDAPDNLYCVRLHIPIITNEGCYFETENEKAHMPADGSGYFVAVNRMHRVLNEGAESRYHLVMGIMDRTGISKSHRFSIK